VSTDVVAFSGAESLRVAHAEADVGRGTVGSRTPVPEGNCLAKRCVRDAWNEGGTEQHAGGYTLFSGKYSVGGTE